MAAKLFRMTPEQASKFDAVLLAMEKFISDPHLDSDLLSVAIEANELLHAIAKVTQFIK
jgi:hypothetical protein